MLDPFTYEAPAQRILFGLGTLARIGEEVRRLGRSRALVLSTPSQKADARRLADQLGALAAGVFSGAAMHTRAAATWFAGRSHLGIDVFGRGDRPRTARPQAELHAASSRRR
jgi:maleylacetate reductase